MFAGGEFIPGRIINEEARQRGWGQRLVAESDIPPHAGRVMNKPPKLKKLRALAELARKVGVDPKTTKWRFQSVHLAWTSRRLHFL
jgi:hypothetical protein